jgi:lipopolysaccharide transport system permease protein
MVASTEAIQQPPDLHETVIEATQGWLALELDDLWRYRKLLYFLTWRDIKVKNLSKLLTLHKTGFWYS